MARACPCRASGEFPAPVSRCPRCGVPLARLPAVGEENAHACPRCTDWHRWGSGTDWGLAITHPWLKNRRSDAAVGPPDAHLGSIAEGSGQSRYPFRRVDLATCLAESPHRFLSRSACQVCFRLRPLPAGSPRSPRRIGFPGGETDHRTVSPLHPASRWRSYLWLRSARQPPTRTSAVPMRRPRRAFPSP